MVVGKDVCGNGVCRVLLLDMEVLGVMSGPVHDPFIIFIERIKNLDDYLQFSVDINQLLYISIVFFLVMRIR